MWPATVKCQKTAGCTVQPVYCELLLLQTPAVSADTLGAVNWVYDWLEGTNQLSDQQKSRISMRREQLQRIARQLGGLRHPRLDYGQLIDSGQAMSAGEVVVFVEKVIAHYEEVQKDDSKPEVVKVRALHDACLAAMLFGHIPPLRNTVMATTQRAGVSDCQSCAKNMYQ